MQFVTYNPQNRFNDTRCAVCLEDYEENERIAELACQHLYHIGCQEAFVRCPCCRTEIAGRMVHITKEELEREVTALARQLPQVTRFSGHIPQEMIQSTIDQVMQYQQRSITSHFNILQVIRQLNSDLSKVLSASEEERRTVINRHAFYVVNQAVVFLTDRPIDETYSLKQLAENVAFLSTLIFEERFVNEYVHPLIRAVVESPRLVEVIRERNRQFKDTAKATLQAMSIWQQCRRIQQYTPTQLEIIADLDIAKRATKIVSITGTCKTIAATTIVMLGTLYLLQPEATMTVINATAGLVSSCVSNLNLFS